MEKASQTLQEKRQELENQLKEIEMNYHRISGAIALINQLISEQEPKEKT